VAQWYHLGSISAVCAGCFTCRGCIRGTRPAPVHATSGWVGSGRQLSARFVVVPQEAGPAGAAVSAGLPATILILGIVFLVWYHALPWQNWGLGILRSYGPLAVTSPNAPPPRQRNGYHNTPINTPPACTGLDQQRRTERSLLPILYPLLRVDGR
jgi:hypothetical protein